MQPKLEAQRLMHVVMALAVGTAASLFLLETGAARKPHPPAAPSISPGARPAPAPAYAELRDVRRGPNGAMYEDAFAALAFAGDPPSPEESAQRAQALAARRERRAYDGAPPALPHAISQREPVDCLTCHRNGARIAGKTARPLSHPEYASCTQCHVVLRSPAPLTPVEPDNTFVGLQSYGPGQRAAPGAPPTIPHPTRMRTRCASCHGPNGQFGLRTPHPDRQSCEQCHAPGASLDQRSVPDFGPIGFDTAPNR